HQKERRAMSLRRTANPVVIGVVSLLIASGAIVDGASIANQGSVPAQSPAASGKPPIQNQQASPVSPLGARNDLPNPYLPGVSWGQLPNGRKWGSTAGIAVDPDGNIWAIDRCGAFGSRGTNCAGSPLDPVLEFDPSGKFIKTWGKKGTGIGEFDCPHTLAFDSQGRLFVGDRQNNRIQVFGQDGHFIAEWKQFGRPSGIFIDKNDVIYVADSESRNGDPGYGYNPGCRRGIRIGSAKDGSVKYFVPDAAPYPAAADSTGPEGITADAGGNMYGAEFTMDVKKYARK